jgi:hypothetical protein
MPGETNNTRCLRKYGAGVIVSIGNRYGELIANNTHILFLPTSIRICSFTTCSQEMQCTLQCFKRGDTVHFDAVPNFGRGWIAVDNSIYKIGTCNEKVVTTINDRLRLRPPQLFQPKYTPLVPIEPDDTICYEDDY